MTELISRVAAQAVQAYPHRHTRGRLFEPRLLQQVLRFAGRVNTVQYVELRGTVHEGKGCDQSIGFIVFDAIVRSWLWSAATRSSPLGNFSILLQVIDNAPHSDVVHSPQGCSKP